MPLNDVPDSTDWLATPLACLASVEAALRCQVCKDFYKTPMLTSCSHTFCSICIRRALSNDGKCPLCRAPEQELKLRSNWSMEDTVDAFSKARPAALALAYNQVSSSKSPKRKAEDDAIRSSPLLNPKRRRTSARLNSHRSDSGNDIVQASEDDEVGGNEDDDGDSDYSPANADSLVPCPMCLKKMKAWQVFQHLEACPGPVSEIQAKNESIKSPAAPQTQQSRQRSTTDRLPALNYSMLKEQALRRKLAELGISNQGSRTLLERRHKEWITIWNANCDSAHPKKRSQLLGDLDIWEKTQGTSHGKTALAAVAIKDKNFDGTAWAAKHDSSFRDLIANARKSKSDAHSSSKGATGKLPPMRGGDEHSSVEGSRQFDDLHYETTIPNNYPQTGNHNITTLADEKGCNRTNNEVH